MLITEKIKGLKQSSSRHRGGERERDSVLREGEREKEPAASEIRTYFSF